MFTMFNGFHQFGFVARDLGYATAMLGERYGVTTFRRKRLSEWMEGAHVWVGNTMLELIVVGSGAPPIYSDYIPDDPRAVRLHHHGFSIRSAEAWEEVNRRVADSGLPVPMKGSAMDGQMHYMYVDTRADLGVYSEYVYASGDALQYYEEIPRIHPS